MALFDLYLTYSPQSTVDFTRMLDMPDPLKVASHI